MGRVVGENGKGRKVGRVGGKGRKSREGGGIAKWKLRR